MDAEPGFKLRSSRLVDTEPGLLGLAAGYGSIWAAGVGLSLAGACGLGLGRVVDEQRQGRLILFGHSARFKSCPRTYRYLHPLAFGLGVFVF